MFWRSPPVIPTHPPGTHGPSGATNLCVSLVVDCASDFAGSAYTESASHVSRLATRRLNLYLGKGRHFAEFEKLLGCAGREHMHSPGDDAGPAGLMTGAEAGAVVAVKVFVEREVIAPVWVLLKLASAPVDRPPAMVVAQ